MLFVLSIVDKGGDVRRRAHAVTHAEAVAVQHLGRSRAARGASHFEPRARKTQRRMLPFGKDT